LLCDGNSTNLQKTQHFLRFCNIGTEAGLLASKAISFVFSCKQDLAAVASDAKTKIYSGHSLINSWILPCSSLALNARTFIYFCTNNRQTASGLLLFVTTPALVGLVCPNGHERPYDAVPDSSNDLGKKWNLPKYHSHPPDAVPTSSQPPSIAPQISILHILLLT